MSDIDVDPARHAAGGRRQRSVEHRRAQYLIRTLVEFLAVSANAAGRPVQIGDVAAVVTARAAAIAAARRFIKDSETAEE